MSKNRNRNRNRNGDKQVHQERMRKEVKGMQKITGGEMLDLLDQAKKNVSSCTSQTKLYNIAKSLGFQLIGQKGHKKWKRYQEIQNEEGNLIVYIGPSSSSSPKGKNWQAPAADFLRPEYVEGVIAFYKPA